MRVFLRALCSDENGIPDEANIILFAATGALIAGAFLVAFGRPFPLGDFAAAICALIPLYRASRGDWRGEKPNTEMQKGSTE